MGESHTPPSDEAPRGSEDLLVTKFSPSGPQAKHLDRPRLTASVDEAAVRQVLLICAPAGFGKTTLVADWAASSSYPVAWLSLDPEDNDPTRFWRNLVLALDRARAGGFAQALELVTPPSVASGRGIVIGIINELAGLAHDVVLVLDDYHMIESEAIHHDVTFLLTHLPAQLHVVIISRSDPPLALGRLRAAGHLAEVRAAELRFTPDESGALLRDVWKLELSPEAVEAVETRTEGWVAGLQLAALSLHERLDPEAFLAEFAGTHRYVLDYLSEEVLDHQSPDVVSFLLETSILERLSGDLCDAVTGRSDGQRMLEALERANLFLIPLHGEHRWYRYHQLFADLLRARLLHAGGVETLELHRRAAAWYERHGFVGDAIGHALASGDVDRAAQLVERNVSEALRRGEAIILHGWLSKLPKEAVEFRPALSFAQAMMQFHRRDLDSADRLLEQTEKAFALEQSQPPTGVPTNGGVVADISAASELLRAEVSGARGDADAAARHAQSALARMAEGERGPRFWAQWVAGPGCDWMRGRLAEAERGFTDLLAVGRAVPDPYPLMLSRLSLGQVQQARGDLEAALRTYREGLREASHERRFSTFNAAGAHWGIAEVLYERDQLDDALRHMTEGMELGRQVMWFAQQEQWLTTLAWIRHAKGDASALETLNGIVEVPDIVSFWNPASSERTRLLLAQGRLRDAERWTEERALSADDGVPYCKERDYLVLARVLIARSEAERATGLLERLEREAESQGRMDSLIRIRALRSLALQSSGKHAAALATLGDALELARPQGYVRVFADEGTSMARLVRSLLGGLGRGTVTLSNATRDHLNRVARAFSPLPAASPSDRQIGRMIEPLTERELEVLRFVAAGKRNREIARELVVSLETVKKHVSNVFRKLGVTSRVQAVAQAQDLGLIPR